MKSEQAMWIVQCLHEVDGLPLIDWRVLKKYADDFELDQEEKEVREDIIHKLQDEIIFLQKNTTKIDENYEYTIKGTLEETRRC